MNSNNAESDYNSRLPVDDRLAVFLLLAVRITLKDQDEQMLQLIKIFGAANESAYYTEFAIKAFRISIDLLIELSYTLNASTDYLLLGRNPDRDQDRKQLLQVISQLSDIARNM